MRTDSDFSAKELEAVRHIRSAMVRQGRTPSVRDLMTAMGYKSPRSAQDILEQLEEKGVIMKLQSGHYQLLMDPVFTGEHAQTVDVPLVGVVSCGKPILAEENIEGYIPVSTSLAKPGARHFFVHARGDSMNKAGIKDGDVVLVRMQSTAEEGDQVVALIDDEVTIKEFHRSNEMIILKPRSTNPKHQPIILTRDFRVQGIVVAVISDLG